MTFLNTKYLLIIIPIILIFVYLNYKLDRTFYNWIKDHWFYKRTKANKISFCLYLASVSLLIIALLDLRGPVENIEGKVSSQKTIILIDSSSSMLTEDVRPNRYKKALLLIKHYVKKAVGQQISLVVFSDGTKRIIPFTEDIDLIEARINSIEKLTLKKGGTALSLAIQESIQFLKNNSEDNSYFTGNILLITDAEETQDALDLNIPDNISVAVIGVGTKKGGTIPIRNSQGTFQRNKRFKGADVVSKLDESFLQKLGNKIKNYKYWIATSYSIPTEEILSFFNKKHKLKESNSSFKIQPVLSEYLLIPAVILFILSILLKYPRQFHIVKLLLVVSLISISSLRAEDNEPKKSSKTIELENKLINNNLEKQGKLVLGSSLLQDGFSKESETLYEENLQSSINENNKEHHFNYATSLLKNGKIGNGIKKFQNITDYLDRNPSVNNKKLSKSIKENILKAFLSQQGGGKGKKQNKEDKNQSNQNDNKDNKQDQSGDDKKNKDSSDKNNKSDNKKKDNEQGNEKNKDKENHKNQNKDKKEDGKRDKKNNKKQDQSSEKNDKKKPEKLPAILKQLKSQDNQLQKKLIDAKTIKRKSRDQKDW